MSRYTAIRSELWDSPEVRRLPLPAKGLYNYILAGPLSNIAGFYKLPIMQIKLNFCRYDAETDSFNPEDVELFNRYIKPALYDQSKLWIYDKDSEQILIPDYLKQNKAAGPKQLKGIAAAVSTLTICPLHFDFLKSLELYCGADAVKLINEENPGLLEYAIDLVNDRPELEGKYQELRNSLKRKTSDSEDMSFDMPDDYCDNITMPEITIDYDQLDR